MTLTAMWARGILFLFWMASSSGAEPVTKQICGVTLLPNGEQAQNCLEATWNRPTADLQITPPFVVAGGQAKVHWTSTGANSCTLTFPGGSAEGISHEGLTVVANAKTTFTLNCQGPGGSATDTVDLNLCSGNAATMDLDTCAKLPTGGTQIYKTANACPNGSVVVIVDDGPNASGKDLMTCCPVSSGVLTSFLAEKNVQRADKCLSSEVATGIKTPKIPLCTKLHSDFQLSVPVKINFVKKATASGKIKALADQFASDDACVCPEGTVLVATGTIAKENVCSGTCATIVKTPTTNPDSPNSCP